MCVSKVIYNVFEIIIFSVWLALQTVRCCFEDRLDHTMTETPMKPLAKIGKSCPIPDRKTTTLKNAKFISRCQEFLNFDVVGFGKPLILLCITQSNCVKMGHLSRDPSSI